MMMTIMATMMMSKIRSDHLLGEFMITIKNSMQEINTGLAFENHHVSSSSEFARVCRWGKCNHCGNNFTSDKTLTIHMF